MKEFRLIYISAPSPYERGVQYGQQAKKEIETCVATYHKHFDVARGMTWDYVRGLAEAFIPVSEAEAPDIMDEVRGIADGSGVDLIDLMVLCTRYEILHFPHNPECTAFALQREATANGHVYVGQNWDNRAYLMEHTLLLHITEEETGNVIFGMTEAGQPMRNGFNIKGVAQCSNSLRTSIDKQGVGVPSTFVRRQLLTLDKVEDMIELIRKASRSVSVNYCVGSKDNMVADIEAVPGLPVCFHADKGILTHANHLLVNKDYDTSSVKRFRGERLAELLQKKNGQITLDYIMECLKDHEGYPQSVCSHVSDDGKQWQTNASLIYDLDELKAWVCYGPPCEGQYKEYCL